MKHDIGYRGVQRGGKKSNGKHLCWNCKRPLSGSRIKKGKRVCAECEKKSD